MPGLRQVAARAGVSLACASYAMRGDPRVAAVTAARVRAAAQALGWHPHLELAARGSVRFASGSGAVPIGYVRAGTAGVGTQARISASAAALGWELRPVSAEAGVDPARLRDRLIEQGMRGVIVDAGPETGRLASFDWSPLPAVLGWQDGHPGPHPAVRQHDPFATVALCAERMASAGHERIGFAIPVHRPRLPSDDRRLAGWLAVRGRLGLDAGIPILDRAFGADEESAARLLTAWIRRHRISAVIGFSVWGWYVLRRASPGTSYAGVLLDPDDAWSVPVAGCVIDAPAIAASLCALLDQQLRGWRAPACELLPAPRWKDGVSLQPPSGSPAIGR